VRFHAPGHGEHTDEILRDLAYTSSQIADLRQAGIV
jgi:crotonobetainyl-CoA:carnitine CoA-transferase CaiB-like acyl-CoA transferase